MRFRLIVSPPAPGAWNMALDHALMRTLRSADPAVLRLYRWSPACLSFGRNQPAAGHYDAAALAAAGHEVVRRPTGGRAVWHEAELTYSVVGAGRGLGGPRGWYAAVNLALRAGLRRFGVPAGLQAPLDRRAPRPSPDACFRDPAPGELVVGGRKLVGSAQYRESGVLLQHGSILLDGSQAPVREFLRRDHAEPAADPPGGIVLSQLVRPLPAIEEIIAAIRSGWEEEFSCVLEPSEPTPEELRAARELERRYRDAAWTWRC